MCPLVKPKANPAKQSNFIDLYSGTVVVVCSSSSSNSRSRTLSVLNFSKPLFSHVFFQCCPKKKGRGFFFLTAPRSVFHVRSQEAAAVKRRDSGEAALKRWMELWNNMSCMAPKYRVRRKPGLVKGQMKTEGYFEAQANVGSS